MSCTTVPALGRGEREECPARRRTTILNEHGYDALLPDIEWAYGELCEEDYAATWLPLDFFPGRKMVDGIKRYLTELPEEPAAT